MDIVTVTGEITYKAWCAPKVALVMIGDVEAKLPVEILSEDALDQLAQTWLNHLYAGVGKKAPVIATPTSGGE